MSFHNHCQGGQCAHSGRGAGGEHIKYWSCTEIGLCPPPSSRQGGGEVSSRPKRTSSLVFFSHRIVSNRNVSNRIVSHCKDDHKGEEEYRKS